ncbi:Hypothetical protein bcf_05075 [Bacillus cereus F837/76]|nr:Hypothetical protein bcf_05075 [Bacillus cereus F837/76]
MIGLFGWGMLLPLRKRLTGIWRFRGLKKVMLICVKRNV